MGAAARDLLLTTHYGIAVSRATKDMDFAVAAVDWPTFLRMRGGLLALDAFQPLGKALHAFSFRQSWRVDLIPFGGVQRADGSMPGPRIRITSWPCWAIGKPGRRPSRSCCPAKSRSGSCPCLPWRSSSCSLGRQAQPRRRRPLALLEPAPHGTRPLHGLRVARRRPAPGCLGRASIAVGQGRPRGLLPALLRTLPTGTPDEAWYGQGRELKYRRRKEPLNIYDTVVLGSGFRGLRLFGEHLIHRPHESPHRIQGFGSHGA